MTHDSRGILSMANKGRIQIPRNSSSYIVPRSTWTVSIQFSAARLEIYLPWTASKPLRPTTKIAPLNQRNS